MMKPLHSVLLVFLFLFFGTPLLAQDKPGVVLKDIVFEKESNKGETISFKLNNTLIPKVFSIKGEKPRVVFDFLDTRSSKLIKHTINTRGDLIQRIRVGVHYKPALKTRVVVDLVPGEKFEVKKDFDKEANRFNVTFLKPGQQAAPSQVQSPPKEKDRQKVQLVAPSVAVDRGSGGEIRRKGAVQKKIQPAVEKKARSTDKPKNSTAPFLSDVTFENTSNKGEMILFKLNDFYPPIVFGLEKGKPRVVCDFLGTTLGKNVKKVINSNGKFVKRIRLAKHKNPDKIRVVLDLVPNSNYDLQQVFFKEDNLFVIIINPLAASDKT